MRLKFLAHKRLSKRIRPRFTWKDVKLPEPQIEILGEILSEIKREKESTRKKKTMQKKGLVALFSGTPGAAKTRAASVLAKKGNLKLYRIDLGTVINKYIGETEKNLSKLFEQAERKSWILFFDEADALFGKRTKIQNTHDRFADQGISFLLQKIEHHAGLVILATNLKGHIDTEIMRRINYIVDFPDTDDE